MAGATTVRVLVVDDDPDFVVLIRDLLGDATRATFLVEDTGTMASGISMVERGHFDVILLDYKLPDGDGFKFLERLEKSHIKVPVVIVTSRGDKIVQVQALEAGAVEYLAKGTFNTELLERTCIYAIGMQEKRNKNGSGPGVGVLIEQLVDLTRDSVKAQTEATAELRETRMDMAKGFESVKADISSSLMATQITLKDRRDFCKEEHARVLSEVQAMSSFRWFLDWIKANLVTAIIIFVCVLLAITAIVLALHFIDLEKIKSLKGATSLLAPFVKDGWTSWVA
ncbi:MAG: response regulator [bacterium]